MNTTDDDDDMMAETPASQARTENMARQRLTKMRGTPGVSTFVANEDALGDDGDRKVTVTLSDLQALVAQQVSLQLRAQPGFDSDLQHSTRPVVKLPTLDEAMAMAEADHRRGLPVKAIATQTGIYVHPKAYFDETRARS